MVNRSWPSLCRLLGIVTIAVLLGPLPANAQQQSAGVEPSKGQPKAGDKSDGDEKPEAGSQSSTSNDRLFYVLPDFLTVHATQLPPLSVGQKFKVVARMSFDPVEYPYYALLAGISQARNSEPGYGQGAAGFGRRYGLAFADGTIEGFMTGAILPSLLREDPRYYLMGKGTFWRRTAYAISRIFITRTDSGHERFNFSEIIGAGLAAGISNYSYHPREDRNLANAASVWGSQVADDTVDQLLTEFWPDMRRKLSHITHRGSIAP